MKKKPEITILIPAYNCERFIAEAIQSVLNQTFTDFELIVLDDGSTDRTGEIAKSFRDPRMRVLGNEHDFIATLNRGLDSATGRYLARMDADDLIPADRLAVQYSILQEYPQIDVCSGWMQLFGENSDMELSQSISGCIRHPLLLMLHNNFVYNATTMCRLEFVRRHNLHYRYYMYAEDFMFWCEAARAGANFFVESQVLYYYRMWENQIGRKYRKEQDEAAWKIRQEVMRWLVEDQTNEEITAFYQQANRLNQQNLLSNSAFLGLFYQLFAQIVQNSEKESGLL